MVKEVISEEEGKILAPSIGIKLMSSPRYILLSVKARLLRRGSTGVYREDTRKPKYIHRCTFSLHDI